MGEQRYKIGYCKVEQKMAKFVSTLSPKGSWVCTSCHFTTSKLLKTPILKIPYPNYNYKDLNGGL